MTSVSSLPVLLDADTLKRLVIAREVYETALSQSVVDSPSANMLAVINFDFSVETLLKVTHSALLSHKKVDFNFPDLLGTVHSAIQDYGKAGMPRHAQILRMHEIRNFAQHQGDPPTNDQVERIKLNVGLCLRETVWEVWHTDFESIDLVDAVQTDDVKGHLLQAKAALTAAQGDYEKVAAYCFLALSTMLQRAAQIVLRNVIVLQEDTEDIALYLALGMDVPQYLRYRSIFGQMLRMANGRIGRVSPNYPLEADQAQFIYSYCVNSVRQIESRIGVLNPLLVDDNQTAVPTEVITQL